MRSGTGSRMTLRILERIFSLVEPSLVREDFLQRGNEIMKQPGQPSATNTSSHPAITTLRPRVAKKTCGLVTVEEKGDVYVNAANSQ